ncbi:MAG: alpha-amylase family glycosyl hydrolase [Cyclobacteriaceae bacterium]
MKNLAPYLFFVLLMFAQCQSSVDQSTVEEATDTPAKEAFAWEASTIYFLLTDRFNNGDTSNDFSFGREQDGAPLRSFMGGDIRGVIQKLDEGYFTDLGVNVLWMTPVFEQIKSAVDEGHGKNYAFHGYWMRDWTTLDPNFGTMEDLAELVGKARSKGIRILFDVVINHTGPVTELDSKWPDEWVRTGPQCSYDSYDKTVSCTLVENLPDILTNSDEEVDLPEFLIEKWTEEGRLNQEMKELDAFFAETGHPRAPRFYIMKWLTDYLRELGIDGFRVDTVKHVEESVWRELYDLAVNALQSWKESHSDEKLDDLPFFMLGEVYNYSIFNGKNFTMDGGEVDIDYYDKGFNSLINFSFKDDVNMPAADIFTKYDQVLQSADWQNLTTVNYISSHDDGTVPDKGRSNIMDYGTKLLLAPGIAQIYYGDETARKLESEEATGDAVLRTFMNWEELSQNPENQEVLAHWQKLGQFRRAHVSVGAGKHTVIQESPLVFSRTYSSGETNDKVIIALDAGKGAKTIPVGSLFSDGTKVTDHYSGKSATVENGTVTIDSDMELLLLAEE